MENTDAAEVVEEERTFWSVNGELRAIWKLSAFFGVWLTASILVFVVTAFLPLPLHRALVQSSILFAGVIAATLFAMLVIDRAPLRDIGFAAPGALRQFGIGVAASIAMIGVVVLAERTLGLAHMRWNVLTLSRAVELVVSGLLLYVIVGVSEEMLMRGYPFRTLLRSTSPVTALLITSVLFSLIHFGNPGIGWQSLCNICLAGIWLGRARIVSGQLWLPIGLHTGWNFAQGTIFGYPVSGIVDETVLVTRVDGARWLTGGDFGPEGGLLVTIVLIFGTLLFSFPRFIAVLRGPEAPAVPAESPAVIDMPTGIDEIVEQGTDSRKEEETS
jgi:membrane protease YdiL (CAAX protease family)